jgi:sugar phosphate isomerase/epimerase
MIRLSFTINPARTPEDIYDYEDKLIKTGIYQGAEIFYPMDEEKRKVYTQAVKSYLKYPNFELICHLPYGQDFNISRTDATRSILPILKDAIVWANTFGIKKLTFHPGCAIDFDGSKIEKKLAVERSEKNIVELTKLAETYGMEIMIENLVGVEELCKTPEEVLDYIGTVKAKNLHFIFDCAHYHTSFGVDNKTKSIPNFIYQLKDHLHHAHISDNNQTTDQHHPLGTGTIDFVSYFKAMHEIGYTGLYSSEVLFHDSNDLIQTALTARKYDGGNN